MVDLASFRVCFLAGCLGQGGAERQLFYILKALRDLGAKPHLLSLTKGEYWEERIQRLGVPVTWVGQRESRIRRLGRIVSAVRKLRPDVVQSQHFFTNPYAVGVARILRIREIGAIRNDVTSEVRANGRFLGPLCLRTPRVIAANSRQGIENAINLGVSASCLKYLPNAVDIDGFQPSTTRKSNGGPVRLLCVGRLVSQKRVDLFLEAVAQVRRESRRTIRATIVGDGPQRANLERQAVELGLLPEVVEFTGAVSDMTAVYREADLLVLASDWEGTPNVLLEAMACGLPVVATSVGGVREIVQHGTTGYLVEPRNVGMMVDRVMELCGEASLRAAFGRGGRQYVLANHSPSLLPRFLQELYGAALS